MDNRSLVIIHTESHRSWGGQEIRVFNECLRMKALGHRVLLLAPEQSDIFHKAQQTELELQPMAFNCQTMVADFFRLRNIFKQYTPDVVNTHGNMDAKIGLLAATGLNIPCVVRSRHHSHPVSPTWYNKLLYRYCSRYIFTSAQCIADQITEDLAVDSAKVVTVSSGIMPPEKMLSKQEAVRQIQSEFALEAETKFIGSVAVLSDWKGHSYLIDAFVAICDQFPDYHLVIVGDGQQMQSLQQQAESSGVSERIHFAGFRDPWPFYCGFELNVLASTKNEATSQTIPQAMYAKCPVIGTWTGGIPEVIEDGKTGLLVPPADSAALALAIKNIIEHPGKTAALVQSAFEVASKYYTMDVMVDRIVELYQRAFIEPAHKEQHGARGK